MAGTWLLAIDMQRIFAEPDSPWATPEFDRAKAGLDRLIPKFSGRVAFTRFLAPTNPSGAWVPYYRDWPFALDPAHLDQYDLVAEYADIPAPIIDRPGFGKWDAAAASLLGMPEHLVVGGVSTDCCVLSTVLAAIDAGVSVDVVSDASAGLSPADHQRALDAMGLYQPQVRVRTVEQVLDELSA
ncbi:MAG: cysteine hydrolase [Microbacteriaceae bacterium]|nr:cysteine hydrolase [Microbacteriaceae bacterium]MCI1207659.1 cysteine hydrolase [Microbacteriaceae bacterium]